MKLRKERLFGAILSIVGVTSAQATILYDNSTTHYGAGAGLIGRSLANAFTLSKDVTLTGIKFSNEITADSTAKNINWAIITIATTTTSPSSDPTITSNIASGDKTPFSDQQLVKTQYGYDYYEQTLTITPTVLTAGTYYLELGNECIATSSGDCSSTTKDAYWVINNGLQGPLYTINSTPIYDSGAVSFSLYGSVNSVPEPDAVALIGIGLVGMGITRKRKHKV